VERWRDRLEYWSEWEVMGLPVRQEEFLKVDRKREGRRAGDSEEVKISGGNALSRERVDDSDLEGERDEQEGEEEDGDERGDNGVDGSDENEEADE